MLICLPGVGHGVHDERQLVAKRLLVGDGKNQIPARQRERHLSLSTHRSRHLRQGHSVQAPDHVRRTAPEDYAW